MPGAERHLRDWCPVARVVQPPNPIGGFQPHAAEFRLDHLHALLLQVGRAALTKSQALAHDV